jgi:hypothetical protein
LNAKFQKLQGPNGEMVAPVKNNFVLSFPFFIFFPLKTEKAPCDNATMLIKPPGTLKCP